jgi:hypothetical protein
MRGIATIWKDDSRHESMEETCRRVAAAALLEKVTTGKEKPVNLAPVPTGTTGLSTTVDTVDQGGITLVELDTSDEE